MPRPSAQLRAHVVHVPKSESHYLAGIIKLWRYVSGRPLGVTFKQSLDAYLHSLSGNDKPTLLYSTQLILSKDFTHANIEQ